MDAAAYRTRERFVLFAGVAAVALLMLLAVAALAGAPLGRTADKLSGSLVVLYLCARLWTHARTLAETGRHELLARIGSFGAPVILLLLLAQIWASRSFAVRIDLTSGVRPQVSVSPLTRLEWSADVAVFVLFFATAIWVWVGDAHGTSRLLSRAAYTVLGFLGADLLAAVWGAVGVVAQARLVVGLAVVAVGGTVLVATVRRVERLDERS